MFARFRSLPASHRDALAREAAERVASELLRQRHANTAAMDAAELRGYLRAKALPIVRAQHERVTGDQMPAAQLYVLTARILEQAVHLAARELEAAPIVVMPAPHVPLRKAA